MMSGCGILTNGKGTRREYCEFSLDELQVCPDILLLTHYCTTLKVCSDPVDSPCPCSGGGSHRVDAQG